MIRTFIWRHLFSVCFTWEIRRVVSLSAGPSNGNRSSSIPSEHWWSVWWNFAAWNCRSLHYFAPDNSRHIFVKVIKIYGELCHASHDVCLLPFYEAFISSKVYDYFLYSVFCLSQNCFCIENLILHHFVEWQGFLNCFLLIEVHALACHTM